MKLGCKFDDIPALMISSMYSAIECLSDYLNEQECSNVVYSFGVMLFKWEEIPASTKAAFLKCMTAKLESLMGQGLANILYGLALMKCSWATLDADLTAALTRASIRIYTPSTRYIYDSPQGLSVVVWALGDLEFRWNDTSPAMQTALTNGVITWGDDMKTQEISNVIYG
jgi:hypothetical protein